MFRRAIVVGLLAASLSACRESGADPSIEITEVPRAAPGGPGSALVAIEGRVRSVRAGQQVVLYARSGAWWVQPFENQPFTVIQADASWKNHTHQGTEYAALLVDPGYEPAPRIDALPPPGGGVAAVVRVDGRPPFWQSWWFRLLLVGLVLLGFVVLHWFRMRQLTRQLHVRFEERLAERTRIAQHLHDTLLQGVISASMQLHVAVDQVPGDSPARPRLNRVLELMGRVTEEGRHAVQGLRSPDSGADDLEQALARVRQELDVPDAVELRVIVQGTPRPLHPVIRDEVYRIGREALVNAFRHARASLVEIEIEYAAGRLRVLVRDNGIGIDPHVLRFGRDGHWGLSGMRERSERIGARLKVLSRAGAGTETELSVPGDVAFQMEPAGRLS